MVEAKKEKEPKYKCEMCDYASDDSCEFRICIQCEKHICESCIIESDICPNCAPHSLEDVDE